MKKIFFLGIAILGFITVNAQSSSDNCYHVYYEIFKARGTYPMTDGEYDNVIITESSELGTFCYTGKAVVQNGKIANMFLKFIDGEYERINKTFKKRTRSAIIDGVSVPNETVDGVKYVVFFTPKLKPKRKSYMAAPNPGDL